MSEIASDSKFCQNFMLISGHSLVYTTWGQNKIISSLTTERLKIK